MIDCLKLRFQAVDYTANASLNPLIECGDMETDNLLSSYEQNAVVSSLKCHSSGLAERHLKTVLLYLREAVVSGCQVG